MVITAPGKMLLAGEYAVVTGEPALVAAVAPYGFYEGPPCPESIVGRFPGAAHDVGAGVIDTSAFFAAGRKLGFGSSACAAVLTAAARTGVTSFTALWRAAQQAHVDLVGGRGSGADTAACLMGGVGLFTPPADDGEPLWQPLHWPAQAELVVVFAEMAADTRVWVQRFRERLAAPELRAWLQRSRQVVLGFTAPDAEWDTLIAAAAALHLDLTAWLGDDLWPASFHRFADLGREVGAPFKPSGAGGGDLGFFFCRDDATTQNVVRALRERHIASRRLRPSLHGVAWRHDAERACDL